MPCLRRSGLPFRGRAVGSRGAVVRRGRGPRRGFGRWHAVSTRLRCLDEIGCFIAVFAGETALGAGHYRTCRQVCVNPRPAGGSDGFSFFLWWTCRCRQTLETATAQKCPHSLAGQRYTVTVDRTRVLPQPRWLRCVQSNGRWRRRPGELFGPADVDRVESCAIENQKTARADP